MLTRNKILSVLKFKIIDVILEENNFQVLQRAIVIFPYKKVTICSFVVLCFSDFPYHYKALNKIAFSFVSGHYIA